MPTPRLAKPSDVPRILELIKELAHFEKEPEAVEVTEAQLLEDGFGRQPKFVCFVIEVEGSVQGIALVYPRYSTWKGEVLHLEDLIVSEAHRGQGLGASLLDAVIRFAHDKGVKRLSWEVLDWNTNAIEFYKSKGAHILKEWRVVQLNETDIKKYIQDNT